MNADTQQQVEQIRDRGYYEQHAGLGLYDWEAVNEFAKDWPEYFIIPPGEKEPEVIKARDKYTAILFFESKYISLLGCMIIEKLVQYRPVKSYGPKEFT